MLKTVSEADWFLQSKNLTGGVSEQSEHREPLERCIMYLKHFSNGSGTVK